MSRWWLDIAIYIAGVLTSAILAQIVRRYIDRPRLRLAVTELAVTCTRNQGDSVLRVTDDARQLLIDWPVFHISWNSDYLSENELDLAILKTIRTEIRSRSAAKEADQLLQALASASTEDVVEQLACNSSLLTVVKNALIEFPDRVAALKSVDDTTERRFQLMEIHKQVSGSARTFVRLDLPGNPWPNVGSTGGRPEINAKVRILADALSYADAALISQILRLTKEYATLAISQYRALRDAFLRIKDSSAYLVVDILAANRGKEPTLVSQRGEVRFGSLTEVVEIQYLNIDAAKHDDVSSASVRDLARRLLQESDAHTDLLRRYESSTGQVPIGSGESKLLRFVSVGQLTPRLKDAAMAARGGSVEIDVRLSQTSSRATFLRHKLLFTRAVRQRQRL